MRVLGLDLGARRIGLAVSDERGQIAFPEGVLLRRSPKRDLAELTELVRERGIERVVIGLPLHMSGRAGSEAEAARRFAHELGEATGLPVDLLDERWSTREAERSLREIGVSPSRQRGRVDEVAATLILRTYLERRGADLEPSSG